MHFDFVINLYQFAKKPSYAKKEIGTLNKLIHKHNAVSKVIFETCYLNTPDLVKLCRWSDKYKVDYIKTSTGYGKLWNIHFDIGLIKEYFNGMAKVSGGIKTFGDCMNLVALGADKIGTSQSMDIIENADKGFLRQYGLDFPNFAKMIEHTNLDPDAERVDILRTIYEARLRKFGAVVVRPKYFKLVKEELKDTNINPVVVIGFKKLVYQPTICLKAYDISLEEKIKEIESCLN